MGLAKSFPLLLDKASSTGDMKVAMASDKLVRYFAKHPSVGCEAMTKMAISAVGRAVQPSRPLIWLHTQLERLQDGTIGDAEDRESLRSQMIGILGICKW